MLPSPSLFAAGFLFLSLLIHSSFSTLPSFAFRRTFSLHQLSVPTPSSSVLLQLPTQSLISSSHLWDNCTDLLITSDSRGVEETSVLDYWFEGECGLTDSTNVYVHVGSISLDHVYVFYGWLNTSLDYSTYGLLTSSRLSWTDGQFVLGSASGTGCWDGWEEETLAEGRYLRLSSSWGERSSGSFTVDDHRHAFVGTTAGSTTSVERRRSYGHYFEEINTTTICLPTSHTHELSGISHYASTLPYANSLRLCKNSGLSLRYNSLLFFEELPLPEWIFPSSSGRFLRGTGPGQVSGQISGSKNHRHQFATVTTLESTSKTDINLIPSTYVPHVLVYKKYALVDHTHDLIGELASVSNEPPYVDLIGGVVYQDFLEIDSSVRFLVMATSLPPLGWELCHGLDPFVHDQRFIRLGDVFSSSGGSISHEHVSTADWTLSPSPSHDVEIWIHSSDTTSDEHVHQVNHDSGPLHSTVYPFFEVMVIERSEPIYLSIDKGEISIGTDFLCFGIDYLDAEVCSGHGSCVDQDQCSCQIHYELAEDCSEFFCHYILNNNPSVCSSHGDCVSHDVCECDSHWVEVNCSVALCHGKRSDDPLVCEERGNCIGPNECECDYLVADNGTVTPMFGGGQCEYAFCFGVAGNDTENVCSSHGNCVDFEDCECELSGHTPNYGGALCEFPICYGVVASQNPNDTLPCSSHGECQAPNHCVCDAQTYSGLQCNNPICFGLDSTSPDVCGGFGICHSPDRCDCGSDRGGDQCEFPVCFGVLAIPGVTHPCMRHGKCVSPNNCSCDENYAGHECEYPVCNGEIAFSPKGPCGGHGICESEGCDCDEGYEAPLCLPIRTSFFSTTTIGFIGGGSGLGLLVGCLTLCLLACCIQSCCSRRNKNRKGGGYSSLRGDKISDLLLKESDSLSARISINEALFQIDFEDIELESRIGSGGGNAEIFLATWKGKEIAFKSFRLALISNDSREYAEFEKEVELLGSLSHPGILRFYGATLAPPRIGIVMEYCAKSDFRAYICSDNPNMETRIRILSETASAMAFLHSKLVIHRDLKPRNVLIGDALDAKVCDFGLSRLLDDINVRSGRTSCIGTASYMAPEMMTSTYSLGVDVFAFGIMLWTCLSGVFEPYGDMLHPELAVANDPSFRPGSDSALEQTEKASGRRAEAFEQSRGWFSSRSSSSDNTANLLLKSDEPVLEVDLSCGEIPRWARLLMERCWEHDADLRPSFKEVHDTMMDQMGWSRGGTKAGTGDSIHQSILVFGDA